MYVNPFADTWFAEAPIDGNLDTAASFLAGIILTLVCTRGTPLLFTTGARTCRETWLGASEALFIVSGSVWVAPLLLSPTFEGYGVPEECSYMVSLSICVAIGGFYASSWKIPSGLRMYAARASNP